MHGIKVAGCTLTPYQGAAYYSDKGEEIRDGLQPVDSHRRRL